MSKDDYFADGHSLGLENPKRQTADQTVDESSFCIDCEVGRLASHGLRVSGFDVHQSA